MNTARGRARRIIAHAYQVFDGSGSLLLTRFALNSDFTKVQVFGANTDGVAGDEIVVGVAEPGRIDQQVAAVVVVAEHRVELQVEVGVRFFEFRLPLRIVRAGDAGVVGGEASWVATAPALALSVLPISRIWYW